MTLNDYIILGLLLLLIIASAIFYYRRKKKGKNACGNCENCPYSSNGCNKKEP